METGPADGMPSPLASIPHDARDLLQWEPDPDRLGDSDLDDDDDRLGPRDTSETFGA